MNTAEIRKAFIDFFSKHQHQPVDSSSLIPAGDPTLLFVNAGMVQFKDCFLGVDKRAYIRAVTCQKCLRISGKHNDLENVGRTARHHTFFEMLGNFSFGDYFKKDAISYAWEFLTEVLELDKRRLWVTIFEDDDEAEGLWLKHSDVAKDRILRCGAADNFWAMGETGPCGPCSEIHYYLGDDLDSQSEEQFRNSDGEYLEIWNLVFMQYNRSASGELTPLPKPSVDTGMGLERVAAVKQNVRANYDSDLLRAIISFAEKLSGLSYDGRDYTARDTESDRVYASDVAMRVVADHSRAVAFLVADGVNPSSDGRGYVLRRLIRRACRHGRVLGFTEPFLYKVCQEVIKHMGGTFPELVAAAGRIERIVQSEEHKFLGTLDTGLSILEKEIALLMGNTGSLNREVSGKVAFLLHDTYGFPLDLTEDIVQSKGCRVNTKEFAVEMAKQKERSRAVRAQDSSLVLYKHVRPQVTKFVGYDYTTYEAPICGIYTQDGASDSLKCGQDGVLVADETPFYAESGGQVGDIGTVTTNSGVFEVFDVQKLAGDTIAHIGRLQEGEIAVGERARFAVDEDSRRSTRSHHSATHLLHHALREVLGTHVQQAGSRVSPQSLRFDFTHYEALTPAQIKEIESRVNANVLSNFCVSTNLLPVDEARQSGAMALFGEKYGSIVRVVQIGDVSRELCGGTHVRQSAEVGFFCITDERSISAGVRRIEAVTGMTALEEFWRQQQTLSNLSQRLGASANELEERVARMQEQLKGAEQQLSQYREQKSHEHGKSLIEKVQVSAQGDKFLAAQLDGLTIEQLRVIADDLRVRAGSLCLILASELDGKSAFVVALTEDLIDKYSAGELVKKLAPLSGAKGGGRANFAQAGGGDPKQIETVLSKFTELLS